MSSNNSLDRGHRYGKEVQFISKRGADRFVLTSKHLTSLEEDEEQGEEGETVMLCFNLTLTCVKVFNI